MRAAWPAKIAVACAVLFARLRSEDRSADVDGPSARGVDIARCAGARAGEVRCVSTLLRRGEGGGSRRVEARFVFAVGSELEPVRRCGVERPVVDLNDTACELRRRYALRLTSARLGAAAGGHPDAYSGGSPTNTTTTPGLADILGQLRGIEISYANDNCSEENSLGCLAQGFLETSAQCNLTTWQPEGCDLNATFDDSSLVKVLETSSAGLDWWEAVVYLRLVASVKELRICGYLSCELPALDALGALPLQSTSAVSLTRVRVADCSLPGISLPSLRTLCIADSALPADCSFRNTDAGDLRKLVLRNVSLSSVPRDLSRFANLEVLDLSMNENMVSGDVASFQREVIAWSRLGNIRSLSLSHVRLDSLSILGNLMTEPLGNKCTPISNMTELLLSGCHIQDLEDENFYRCLSSLNILDLSQNRISTWSSRVFYKLEKVKFINLSHNGITALPELELHNGTTLEFLDLSHNGITSLNNFVRSGSTSVLNLSFNKISEWSVEEMFCLIGTYRTWVQHLNLSFNSLRTVSRVMGDSMLILKSVDLRGNRFDCSDCNTTEFRKWLEKTMFKYERLTVVGTDHMSVVCSAPEALAGRNLLAVEVDSSHCDLAERRNYVLLVAVPLAAVLLLTASVGSALAYKFRFELAYIRYYWSIKTRKNSAAVTETGEYDFDAFVSYSSHDRAWVLGELMEQLEASGERYRLCLHERDFRLGSLILENIECSMRKSRFTLVVLSRGFVDSQWCRWELEMANYKLLDGRREFLILLELERLERRRVPRHLKYLIETRTCLQWPGAGAPPQQRGNFWRRLRRALGESLHQRRQRLSAAAPPHARPPRTTTTTTNTTTLTTTTTTTTTTTVVASDDNVDKNCNVAPSVVGPLAVLVLPHAKLTEESEV
ncbi:toll-like receptor 2 isoform X2 [Bacillus rossius redtenbacheri]|uniref:toll-like receptor 2 isoform X2 n=1 Tax=Bacillus rossius redtenbacheri TaxID=93214 RepID=UPI002FDD7381